jgi:hypothetical protein
MMEDALTQIARYFLYSVGINAATLLIIVGIFGYYFRQIQQESREISQAISNVAAMTRDVAAMTREMLRRSE